MKKSEKQCYKEHLDFPLFVTYPSLLVNVTQFSTGDHPPLFTLQGERWATVFGPGQVEYSIHLAPELVQEVRVSVSPISSDSTRERDFFPHSSETGKYIFSCPYPLLPLPRSCWKVRIWTCGGFWHRHTRACLWEEPPQRKVQWGMDRASMTQDDLIWAPSSSQSSSLPICEILTMSAKKFPFLLNPF